MSIDRRFAALVLFSFFLVAVAAVPAQAGQYRLAAAGVVSANTSGDSSIPIGTPWSFELTYDTAAPDLDFELLGAADPMFGRFTNSASPPALRAFHYRAGDYEVTLDEPADFGVQRGADHVHYDPCDRHQHSGVGVVSRVGRRARVVSRGLQCV